MINQPRSTRRARRVKEGVPLILPSVLRVLCCGFFTGLYQPRSTRRTRRSDRVLLTPLCVLRVLGNCVLRCPTSGRPAQICSTFFSIFNLLARPRSMQGVCISNSQTHLRALRVLRGSFFSRFNLLVQPRSMQDVCISNSQTSLSALRVLRGLIFLKFNLLALPQIIQGSRDSCILIPLRDLRALRG
jgi:hypothetical protein